VHPEPDDVSASARWQARHPTTGKPNNEKVHPMLYTIAVVLLILWLLGLVSSYTLGGFIHILLVVAIVMVLVNLISGRRSV
jgi:mannose/fructose/N-acetylgalactosamine-specific phosphotransferase system component IID